MKKRCVSCLKVKPIPKGHRKWCKSCVRFLSSFNGGRDLNREKVRIRAGHTCKDCKKKWKTGERRFDIHHLRGLCGKKSRLYDQPDGRSLAVLCHRCHMRRHHAGREKESYQKRPLVGNRGKVLDLLRRGKTYAEVGDVFDVSHAAVWYFINNRKVSSKIQSV